MNSPDAGFRLIFADTLDCPAGPVRAAYLDQACRGDAALRARVEGLIRANERAGRFLSPGEAPAHPRPVDRKATH